MQSHRASQRIDRRLVTALLLTGACLSPGAWADNNVSTASALSVVVVGSVIADASGGKNGPSTASMILATSGVVFVVKAVEVSATGTVYMLERVSDGARVSVEVLGKAASGVSVAVGATVTTSVIGAGVLLTASGQTLAFIPNALGQALLHNELVTP